MSEKSYTQRNASRSHLDYTGRVKSAVFDGQTRRDPFGKHVGEQLNGMTQDAADVGKVGDLGERELELTMLCVWGGRAGLTSVLQRRKDGSQQQKRPERTKLSPSSRETHKRRAMCTNTAKPSDGRPNGNRKRVRTQPTAAI